MYFWQLSLLRYIINIFLKKSHSLTEELTTANEKIKKSLINAVREIQIKEKDSNKIGYGKFELLNALYSGEDIQQTAYIITLTYENQETIKENDIIYSGMSTKKDYDWKSRPKQHLAIVLRLFQGEKHAHYSQNMPMYDYLLKKLKAGKRMRVYCIRLNFPSSIMEECCLRTYKTDFNRQKHSSNRYGIPIKFKDEQTNKAIANLFLENQNNIC